MRSFFCFICLLLCINTSVFSQDSRHKTYFVKNFGLAKDFANNDLKKADSLILLLQKNLNKQSDSMRLSFEMFLADYYLMKGNKDFYFSKIDKLYSEFSGTRLFHSSRGLFLRNIHLLIYQKKYELANQITQKELANNPRRNSYEYNTLLYYLTANLKMQLNERQEALALIERAVLYARKNNDKKLLAEIYHQQAVIYNHFGQIDMAVVKNQIALQLAEQISNLTAQAKYNFYLATSQLEINNFKDAVRYFNRTIVISQKTSATKYLALAHMYLGVIDGKFEKYDQALAKIEDAIASLHSVNDEDGLGLAYSHLGDLFLQLKRYPDALNKYNQSLVYFESTGNRIYISKVYQNVGLVFEQQNKFANALNYFNRSLAIRKELGYTDAIAENYKSISEIYAKKGDLNNAYQFLKLYSKSADSSKFFELSSKIAELNQSYRSEQREQLILSQADSIEKQRHESILTSTKLENIELKNQMKNYVIFGFVLLLVFGGIIVFYNWNQERIKQQQQQAEMNQTLLRSQMNPHFVFNAMSVIQSYIYAKDTTNSSRFLVQFSKLMRLILENSSKEFISLETEYQILDKYLSVQKMRFEDRFDYEVFIEESLYHEQAMIPPMITQPFIENAIEHGQLHLRENGYIHTHIYRDDKVLMVVIEDNGVGIKNAEANKKSKDHKSMAMKITRERIENMNRRFRTQGYLTVQELDEEKGIGTKITLALPYKTKVELT